VRRNVGGRQEFTVLTAPILLTLLLMRENPTTGILSAGKGTLLSLFVKRHGLTDSTLSGVVRFETMLTRKPADEVPWYPVSIVRYEMLLGKVIRSGKGYATPYALRKNIAYNLQYIEFLCRCLTDLKISSVIEKLIWKNFIIVGCGIIESLLHFLLITEGQHKTTEWD
jgi:hypothetical protein